MSSGFRLKDMRLSSTSWASGVYRSRFDWGPTLAGWASQSAFDAARFNPLPRNQAGSYAKTNYTFQSRIQRDTAPRALADVLGCFTPSTDVHGIRLEPNLKFRGGQL